MKILKKRRKRTSSSKKRRTAKRNPTPRRKRARKITRAKVNPMKRRKGKRKSYKRSSRRRSFHRTKRNPSVASIANSLVGVLAAGAGGVAVVKLSNAVGTLTGFDTPGKKNIIKLGLTLLAAYMLPKYIRHAATKSFIDGMGAVTAISFVQTATGTNLLSGTDEISEIVDTIDGYNTPNMLGYTLPMNGYMSDAVSMNDMLGVEDFTDYGL